MKQRLVMKFCFKTGKSAMESLRMVNAAYGSKQYSVRLFSDGMDVFMMGEKALKTTPGVAGLQRVAVTMSKRFLSCCFRTVTFL